MRYALRRKAAQLLCKIVGHVDIQCPVGRNQSPYWRCLHCARVDPPRHGT